jgi:glycine C-acetyltransferase
VERERRTHGDDRAEGDFLVSDALNHASIIDSMRLAKAITKCTTAVYKHGDMDDLRAKLAEAKGARRRMIWTDGIFSMEGAIAKLPDILQIARDTNSVVAVDDSHATGVLGKTGRGTAEHFGLLGEVDIITSTLGKALGGAAGGSSPVRRARGLSHAALAPQLFSNALPPTVAMSALAAVDFVEKHPERVRTLRAEHRVFPRADHEAGFKPLRARRRSCRSSSERRRRRFR